MGSESVYFMSVNRNKKVYTVFWPCGVFIGLMISSVHNYRV